MNRWLHRVYPTQMLRVYATLTLAALIALATACSSHPTGQILTSPVTARTTSAWHPAIIAGNSNGTGNVETSSAIINLRPAITFRYIVNGFDSDPKYVRANDADGTDWGTVYTVDGSGDSGRFSSMIEVRNGGTKYPFVAYQRDGDLYCKRATVADGSSWPFVGTQLEAGTDTGVYATASLVGAGEPAIAWVNADDGSLRYCKATNSDGTAWNPVVTVISSNVLATGIGFTVVDGQPAIAYTHDGTNKEVRFVRAALRGYRAALCLRAPRRAAFRGYRAASCMKSAPAGRVPWLPRSIVLKSAPAGRVLF
jgi:hypothetical protein